MVIDHLVPGARTQDRERLFDAMPTVRHVDAERAEFGRRETAPDPHFEPPAAQHVERADALGDVQRVVIRQGNDAQAQAQMPRASRQRGEHQVRLRRVGVAGHQMMLDDPHAVEPQPVGELDFVERVRVDVRLAAAEMRRHGELVEKIDEQLQPPLGPVSWRA